MIIILIYDRLYMIKKENEIKLNYTKTNKKKVFYCIIIIIINK